MPTSLRTFAVFGNQVRSWWGEPVDYPAQVQYFSRRTMSVAIKMLIGLGTGFNAVVSLLVLLPSAHSTASRVAVALFAVLQFFWSWMWCCRPWPSRRISLTFVISADIGIAAVAVLDASWLLGLFGFNAFAMISVYLMFFDGPKVLARHALWILLSTTAFAVQFGAHAHIGVVDFAARTLASVALVVAMPLGTHFGIWVLRNDANDSITDPLTGILNRRGLYLHVGNLLRDKPSAATDLTVMVVDLDRFKDVNDTHGHTIGDQVLIRSAAQITSAVGRSALVARIGGEEFVVVDLVAPGEAERNADRVRRAIAGPAEPAITASIGVTSIPLAHIATADVDPVSLLDDIVERADGAMFDAKRIGGDATIHTPGVDESR
ncbi:sensor domain-containing diguanylate cyclase [Mycolicibacterium komossense]|uniref:Diguanylate cyclase n=1 Tax=Mycolicibacterium komossense TaxID=1779 RepID=A0ABT3C6L5_9MYCO|nr:sensor domain-containing diguanylate cyclase [Mycolicibacterium komossense]MCV7225071.1 diguanylate cyclase [Mycolicibacterium komossense]